MSWVSLSLRKLTLKNRINNLESDLVRISQALQTAEQSYSYEEQRSNLFYNYELSQINQNYQGAIAGAGTDSQAVYSVFQAAVAYQTRMQMQTSIFNAESEVRRRKSDAETSALEAEQTEVETQLSAARAEYDSLTNAIHEDIKKNAITLVNA